MNTYRTRILLSSVLLSGISLPTVRAEENRPVAVEDLIGLRSLPDSPAVSSDGKWLAYAVKTRQQSRPVDDNEFFRSGLAVKQIGCDVFVLNMETRDAKNLTGGKGDNWHPVWSPNGRYLAFLSDRDGKGQAKLWVWDSRGNELRKLADAAIRMWGVQEIAWSRDSQQLFVPTIPDGLPLTEYLERVTSGGSFAKPAATSASGSTVMLYESAARGTDKRKWAGGRTLGIDQSLHDVVAVNLATGRTTTLLHNQRVALFRVTRDDARLVYSSPQGLAADGSQQILYDLAVLDRSTGRVRMIASQIPLDFFGRFSVSPDSSLVSYRANPDSDRVSNVYVVGVNGGEPRNVTHFDEAWPTESKVKGKTNFSVTPIWDAQSSTVFFVSWHKLWKSSVRTETTRLVGELEGHAIRQVVGFRDSTLWSPDAGQSAVLLAHDYGTKQDGIYKLDLATGASRKILERSECYVCGPATDARYIAVSGQGKLFAYVAEDAQRAADLWVGDFESGKSERLTHLNPQLDEYAMGVPKLIDWLDADGQHLQGGLLLPSGYEPGKRYPLLVLVYGGTTMSDTMNRFGGFERGLPYLHPQLFTTRGYGVFMPDAPQHMGTAMLDLAKTVLPGINKVIEMGIADPGRLGLMGHSYGGYSTMALLVQTKRFRAAVEADGMANLIGFYGEMEKDGVAFGTSSETSQEQVGGSPWEFRERYIENSPIFYLDRIETPLLIIHGGEDVIIAPFLGDEIFVGLRRLGKTVSYAKYLGEPHVPSGYGNSIDIATRMVAWFDKYVKAGESNN